MKSIFKESRIFDPAGAGTLTVEAHWEGDFGILCVDIEVQPGEKSRRVLEEFSGPWPLAQAIRRAIQIADETLTRLTTGGPL